MKTLYETQKYIVMILLSIGISNLAFSKTIYIQADGTVRTYIVECRQQSVGGESVPSNTVVVVL